MIGGFFVKIAIVGAGISGVHAAIALRKEQPDAEITLYEEKAHVGYAPSSLSQRLKNKMTNLNEGQLISSQELCQQFQIQLHTNCLVSGLSDPYHLLIKDQKVFFDYLVLAYGSTQSSYKLENRTQKNSRIFTFKHLADATLFLEQLENFKSLAVIGAGPVGLEITEGLLNQNKKVTLFDSQKYPLFKLIDQYLGQRVNDALQQNKVTTCFSETVLNINDAPNDVSLATTKGSYSFDAVLLAVNTRPQSSIWQNFIKTNPDQTVIVNEFLQTNHSHIFAIGDIIQSYFKPLNKAIYPALASNAIRTAHLVAKNIPKVTTKDFGTLRVSQHDLFGFHIFQAGITEKEALFAPNEIVTITEKERNNRYWTITKKCLDAKTQKLIGVLVFSNNKIDSLKNDWLKQLNAGLDFHSNEVPFFIQSIPYQVGEINEN